jgi:hypothetical protein
MNGPDTAPPTAMSESGQGDSLQCARSNSRQQSIVSLNTELEAVIATLCHTADSDFCTREVSN